MFVNKNRKNTNKKELEPKTKCIVDIHYPHDTPISKRDWSNRKYLQYTSIDIGSQNYCIRIERHYTSQLTIVPIIYDKFIIPITFGENPTDRTGEVRYYNLLITLTNILDQYKKHILNSNYVIIERQRIEMARYDPIIKLFDHTVSYMVITCKNNLLSTSIIEVSNQLKSKMFHLKMSKDEMKDWVGDEATIIHEKRKDMISLKIINHSKKKDDLGDVIIQMIAFILYICSGFQIGIKKFNPSEYIESLSGYIITLDYINMLLHHECIPYDENLIYEDQEDILNDQSYIHVLQPIIRKKRNVTEKKPRITKKKIIPSTSDHVDESTNKKPRITKKKFIHLHSDIE